MEQILSNVSQKVRYMLESVSGSLLSSVSLKIAGYLTILRNHLIALVILIHIIVRHENLKQKNCNNCYQKIFLFSTIKSSIRLVRILTEVLPKRKQKQKVSESFLCYKFSVSFACFLKKIHLSPFPRQYSLKTKYYLSNNRTRQVTCFTQK